MIKPITMLKYTSIFENQLTFNNFFFILIDINCPSEVLKITFSSNFFNEIEQEK